VAQREGRTLASDGTGETDLLTLEDVGMLGRIAGPKLLILLTGRVLGRPLDADVRKEQLLSQFVRLHLSALGLS
jgi:hypothetical protein